METLPAQPSGPDDSEEEEEEEEEEDSSSYSGGQFDSSERKDHSHTLPPSELKELSEDMVRAKAQLQEALELIPDDQKTAYNEAMKQAPHLVEIESNPERYLRFDNFDPWAAAKRIVDYWAARVDIFKERAFLPLLLTGQGALSEEDMEVFKTGFIMLLPETKKGRPVMYHDRARLTNPEVMVAERRLRCMFYVISALSELNSSAEHGVDTIVAYSNKTRKSTFDLKMLIEALNLFACRQIIPVRYTTVHLVMLSSRPIMNTVAPLTVQALERLGTNKPMTVVHTRKPLDDIQDDLKKHGFELEGLPKVPLGGLFTFGCFRRWIDGRLRRERRIYEGIVEDVAVSDTDGKKAAIEDTPEEELARKRREVDAAYARRKRARKKIEMKVLEAEVDRLNKQQESFRKTGEELEKKVQEANRIVQLIEMHSHQESLSSRMGTVGALGAPQLLVPPTLASAYKPIGPIGHLASEQLVASPYLHQHYHHHPSTLVALPGVNYTTHGPATLLADSSSLFAYRPQEQLFPMAGIPIYAPTGFSATSYPHSPSVLLNSSPMQQRLVRPIPESQHLPPTSEEDNDATVSNLSERSLGSQIKTAPPPSSSRTIRVQPPEQQQQGLFQEFYDILSGDRNA